MKLIKVSLWKDDMFENLLKSILNTLIANVLFEN